MTRLFVLIVSPLFLLIPACDQDPEVLEEEVYEQLLIEFTILNQMDESYLGGRSIDDLREKVYSNYNITQEKFHKSHEYYQQNIPEQLERIEKIGLRLRQERDSVQTAERQFRTQQSQHPDSLRKRLLNREKDMEAGEAEDEEALKLEIPADTVSVDQNGS
jgi:hypothetical protein